jgi:pyruvate/2-oxoglutarate/acetoin dehydrogenase E1 component
MTETLVETEQLTYAQAINRALAEEMRRDERVWMMGQDIGAMGGVFGVTRDLLDEFGEQRVRDTAIVETFIVGGAAGAAMTGTIPVVELQFADFLFIAGDEVLNKLAKWRYMHGGKLELPVVVRAPMGIVGGVGAEHSQCPEAMLLNTPGLKIVLPASPADAKGLLKTAIRDRNPVIFLEHKGLYRVKGDVPTDPEFLVPFGQARVAREGSDLTIVATAMMVDRSLDAAERLAAEGIDVEVIDPRTLVPFDMETIARSVEKTSKVMVVHEAPKTGGAGGEIAARIQEELFFSLDGPVVRVAGADTPIPQSPVLEQVVIPSSAAIEAAARELYRL